MTRDEFINILRRNIAPINDYQFINETIEYYQSYIETEIRKGSSESEVLDSLGDPRLIAKSIMASHGIGGNESYEEAEPENMENTVHITTKRGKNINLPAWMAKACGIAIGVGVVIVVGFVAVKLLPVICVCVLVGLIYKFIRDNL